MARPRAQNAKRTRPKSPVLRIEGLGIVLLGSFNPSIFHPEWMVRQGLLEAADVDSAAINIVHNEVASFRVAQIAIEVTRDRFEMVTTDATAFERLRDLLVGTFGRLSHTPVSAAAINRNTHYEMTSEAKWHALGHVLAPKEPWQSILSSPGTRSLTIEGVRPDEHAGAIRV
jgi:hypothetical protein